ncbi:MAG TPA: tripartite tricarboxylate transporter TctB family protein [Myxococcaceae bacterium]|nr:tripartite tricarboxylate transporter TctB family protein [Myxococcaceae bacterium]
MRKVRVRAPQDLVAGASLVAVSLFAIWATAPLAGGRLGAPGPGFVPRVLAVLLGASGAGLCLLSLTRAGEPLGRWPLRGPLLIGLAVVAFALTIRVPGLVVAGPLAILVAGAASPETRWRELAIFSVAVTACCIGLFRTLLHLPIPVLVLPGWFTL